MCTNSMHYTYALLYYIMEMFGVRTLGLLRVFKIIKICCNSS